MNYVNVSSQINNELHMKRLTFLLLIAFPLISICQNHASSKKSWVQNPPESKERVYAVGVGTSPSADIAERKAHLNASAKLAEIVEPAVVSVTSRIDPVIRGNKVLMERTRIVRKTVIANLSDVQTIDSDKIEKDGLSTVYVLVSMPRKEITKRVVEQIREDKQLYEAVFRTREYKKMVKETR